MYVRRFKFCIFLISACCGFVSTRIRLIGIGAIPDAVLAQLGNHKNLGVHSEMFSDGVVDLCEKGAITNNEKEIMTGKIVSSFAVGTKRLYDFMNNNPFVGRYKYTVAHFCLHLFNVWTRSFLIHVHTSICKKPKVYNFRIVLD